jgi:hypothetical protein
MKKLYSETDPFICDVFEGDDGQMYLVALCGGIAWGRVGVVMTAEEVVEFRTRPAFAPELARKLCKDFAPYKDRAIPEDVEKLIIAADV